MRPLRWALSQCDRCPYTMRTKVHMEEMPWCEDTKEDNQGQWPQKSSNLTTPWSHTSGLQNCEKCGCSLATSSVVLWWQLQQCDRACYMHTLSFLFGENSGLGWLYQWEVCVSLRTLSPWDNVLCGQCDTVLHSYFTSPLQCMRFLAPLHPHQHLVRWNFLATVIVVDL